MNRSRSRFAPRFRRTDGITLIETSIAMALAAVFLLGLMLARTNMIGLLQRTKENASASQYLQQRVEEMRIANWLQITDATYLSGTMLAKSSDSAATLTSPVETITVTNYPAVAGQVPAKVVRQNGVTSIISKNDLLKDGRMVRIDVDLNWTGIPGKRARARSTSVIIAKGGISK